MRRVNKILAAIVLAIPLGYVGAYLALVERGELDWDTSNDLYSLWTCRPNYRLGGEAARVMFAPAYTIDLRVRPDYWIWPPGIREVELDPRWNSP